MAGAGVAIGRDPSLAYSNPASAAGAIGTRAIISGRKGFLDDLSTQLVLATNLLDTTLFVGWIYESEGSVTLNTSLGTSRTVRAREDTVGYLGAAGSYSRKYAWGILAKLYKSRLAEEYSASAVAFDCGARVLIMDALAGGIVLDNVGKHSSYLEDSMQLPVNVKAGFAYRFFPNPFFGNPEWLGYLNGFVDGRYYLSSRMIALTVGGECLFGDALTIRVGGEVYREGQTGSVSAGIGAMFGKKGASGIKKYRFDYGVRLSKGPLDRPQSIGLTVIF
ncbi:MAG: PorV/PorQ family protein [Planctomycetota bacterium]|jgi:hypothetical protein